MLKGLLCIVKNVICLSVNNNLYHHLHILIFQCHVIDVVVKMHLYATINCIACISLNKFFMVNLYIIIFLEKPTCFLDRSCLVDALKLNIIMLFLCHFI